MLIQEYSKVLEYSDEHVSDIKMDFVLSTF